MKRRKAGWLTGLVILALITYACISLVRIQSKLRTAEDTTAELTAEADTLERENAELQYAVDNADDPEVIEGIARDKLGLVKPDDKIYKDPTS